MADSDGANIDAIILKLKNDRNFIDGIRNDIKADLVISVKGDDTFRSGIMTAMNEDIEKVKDDLVLDFEVKYVRNLFSFIMRFAPWLFFTGVAAGIIPAGIFIYDYFRAQSNQSVAEIIESKKEAHLKELKDTILSNIDVIKNDKLREFDTFKTKEETSLTILDGKINDMSSEIESLKNKIDETKAHADSLTNEISTMVNISQNKVLQLQQNMEMSDAVTKLDSARKDIIAELAINIRKDAEFRYMLWRYLTPDDYLLAVSQNASCPDGFSTQGNIDMGWGDAMKSLLRSQALESCLKKQGESECNALMTRFFGTSGLDNQAVFDAGVEIKLCVKSEVNDPNNVQ